MTEQTATKPETDVKSEPETPPAPESPAETEKTADAEPEADAGSPAETEATADAESQADAGSPAETEKTADAEPEADAGSPAETEKTADAEPRADAPETPAAVAETPVVAEPRPAVEEAPVAHETPAPTAPPVPGVAPEVTPVGEDQPVPPTRKPSRRVLWAVARWTAAVLVCGGLGAGTAFGIASMERHEVPGLATENDGRWAYPKLSLPALPADAPRPYSDGNPGEIHHADLRKLLLPAPAGATPDPKLDGGWVTVDQYVAQYVPDERAELKDALKESALRHIAARGWTMPDGTTTRIHLLRFNSVAFAEAFKDDVIRAGSVDGPLLEGAEGVTMDSEIASDVRVTYTALYSFVELPKNADQARWAYIQAGDTLALVTQTRKGEALQVPFQQTVTLQNQLLG